ncbi:MAG: ABC transporter ATP-binding protein [Gammaproteobacteria bacterium]|nr:ABC transporter ATP-binding protein [Gammaproteobacteria bacterium]
MAKFKEILSLNKVNKCYGDLQALENISFSVGKGEIVALIGNNGSGKTTTIRSICHLLKYDTGNIHFDGQEVTEPGPYLKKIGVVLEGSRNCHWRLNPIQNAKYFAGLKGYNNSKIKQRIQYFIEILGLNKYQNMEVGKLSTGNRQKTALLCSLIFEPKLTLLDEPTLGLDIETTEALKNAILKQVANEGTSLLITSHNMDFIDKICDRVIVIEQGKIVFNDTLEKLKNRLYKYELNIVESKQTYEHLQTQLKGYEADLSLDFNCRDATTSIKFNDTNIALSALSYLHNKNIHIQELSMHTCSMEKAYVELLRDNKL